MDFLASSRRYPRFIIALIVVVVAVAELAAFNRFAVREVTWTYPIAFDQTSYGLQSFHLYEGILKRGFMPAVIAYTAQPIPQGLLVQIQGALLCLAFGPGWLRLLNVNILYFLVLQAATAYGAWYVSGRRLGWALLAVGLVLTLSTPYYWAGGVMDFRLDFVAFCVYGVFIAAVICSQTFASRRWSFVAGAVSGVLIWLRTLTVTYLFGVSLVMIVFLLLRKGLRANPQVRNACLALCVLGTAATPVVAMQSHALYRYYWVGHVSGQEPAIRAGELGLGSLWTHLVFYPSSLLGTHLGRAFLASAGLILLAAFAGRRDRRIDGRPDLDALTFCTVCLVIPLAVLTLDVSKSGVVASITDSAVVWLVLLGAMRLGGSQLLAGKVGTTLVAAVLVLGMGHTSWELTRHLPTWFERSQVRQIVDVYERMRTALAEKPESEPRGLSILGVHEYLRTEVADFLLYERHRQFLGLTAELGHRIVAADLEECLASIDRSAFVVTSERPAALLVYPFDRSVQPLLPVLTEYIRERFIYVTEFSFRGVRHELYRRPVVQLRGVSGDWLTADGLSVEIGEDDRQGAARVLLKGTSDMSRVQGLKISAVAVGRANGLPDQPVPAELDVRGNDYAIALPLTGVPQARGPLSLRLTFSRYWIPREAGLNNDARKLVILVPRERTLLLNPAVAPSHH